jgi:hypothetical protein
MLGSMPTAQPAPRRPDALCAVSVLASELLRMTDVTLGDYAPAEVDRHEWHPAGLHTQGFRPGSRPAP